MLVHPHFDPVAIAIGPLAIRWYGIMYLIAFGLFFFLGRYRARLDAWRGVSYQLIDDLLFYGVLGVVLGGRLGLHPVLQGRPLPRSSAWKSWRYGRAACRSMAASLA
jgi:prolipoprotein diacylglyceryltransferase